MKKVMENVKNKFAAMKAVAQNRLACRDFAAELADDNAGMGTIEIVLIIVEIFTLHYIFFYDIVHNVVLNH